MRPTHQSSPPPSSIHSIGSASRISVATRGRVVGLVLARVVDRRLQARGRRAASVRWRRRARATRSIAAGLIAASQRPPSEAKPFCGASSRRRPGEAFSGRPPVPEVASTRTSAPSGSRRALDARPSLRSMTRLGPGDRVGMESRRVGSGVAGLGLDPIGSARNGAPAVPFRELRGELAVDQLPGAVAYKPGAAASQQAIVPRCLSDDLVAFGQAEELGDARLGSFADRIAHRLLASDAALAERRLPKDRSNLFFVGRQASHAPHPRSPPRPGAPTTGEVRFSPVPPFSSSAPGPPRQRIVVPGAAVEGVVAFPPHQEQHQLIAITADQASRGLLRRISLSLTGAHQPSLSRRGPHAQIITGMWTWLATLATSSPPSALNSKDATSGAWQTSSFVFPGKYSQTLPPTSS